MNDKYRILLLFVFGILTLSAYAQPEAGWDNEKLMATRFQKVPGYSGSQFYNDDWVDATITLRTGETLENVPVKYNGYVDELISYNKVYYTLVQLEKETIQSFEYNSYNMDNYFEIRNFGSQDKENNCFFQVYYDGGVDFLCSRKIELITCPLYVDASGVRRNQEFEANDRFFIYDEEDGYHPVSLKKKSLLRYISKEDKKQVKKLMRQNNVFINTPVGYAYAIQLLEENNIELKF